MNDLKQALRYPWQTQSGISRLLLLALLQLIPVVGQLILIGYGQAVARSVSNAEPALPKLNVRGTFVDGLRLAAIGLVYCLPIFLMVLVVMSSEFASAEGTGTLPTIIFPLTLIAFGSLSAQIVKRRPSTQSFLSILNKLVRASFLIFIFFRLFALFTAMQAGFEVRALLEPATAVPLLLISMLMLGIIRVILLASGVQHALTGASLLKPKATLRPLLAHRQQTVRFALRVWGMTLGTLIATAVGAFFLLLPGLLLFVSGTLSLWVLAAEFWAAITVESSSA